MSDLACSEAPVMPLTSLAALAQATDQVFSELVPLLQYTNSPGVAGTDPAPLIDAARRLAQLQGALELIDQPGLAALTGLVRDQLINTAQPGADAYTTSRLILQRFQSFIRAALRALLGGDTLSTAELIHYWHQQLVEGGPSTLQPYLLVMLDIDQSHLSDLPSAEVIEQPVPDPDHLLLTLLRAPDDQASRAAASQIAALFAEAAAMSPSAEQRAHWLAIQACFIEYALVGGDPTSIKKIAAAGVRLRRQKVLEQAPTTVALGSLAREALYYLAQQPLQSALAHAVAKVFRLEQQFAMPARRIITDLTDDQMSAASNHALDVLITSIESNPACIEDTATWKAWIDTTLTSACFAPVADALHDILARIGSAPHQPMLAEALAAGLCCLRECTDHRAMLATIRTMRGSLFGAEPYQCLDELGQRSRADGAHGLCLALVSTMQADMALVEQLLDTESAAENASAHKTAISVLNRIAGALWLLDASTERERVIGLRDSLNQLSVNTAKNEAFAQQWVALQATLAQLPWRLTLQTQHRLHNETSLEIDQAQQVPTLPQPQAALDAIFIDEARALMQSMAETIATSDMTGLAQSAHTLAGCSATVGLTGMAELALALESSLELIPVRGARLEASFIDTVLSELLRLLEDFESSGERGNALPLVQRLREAMAVPTLDDSVETMLISTDQSNVQPDDQADDQADDQINHLNNDLNNDQRNNDQHHNNQLHEYLTHSTITYQPGSESEDVVVTTAEQLAPAGITSNPISSVEDDELYELFKLEAADLLPQLEQSLRQWQLQPEDGAQAAQLLRVLHTLKGSARMAGRGDLGEAFHQAETEVGALQRQAPDALAPAITSLLHRVDLWTYTLTQPANSYSDNSLAAAPVFDHAAGLSLASDAGASEQLIEPSVVPKTADGLDASVAPAVPPKEQRSQMLRVRADRLAQFADTGAELWSGNAHLAELLLAQRRSLTDLAEDISRLRAQLRELEIEAESRVVARTSQAAVSGLAPLEFDSADVDSPEFDSAEFDPLEFDRYTRLHELTRMMAESVTDLVGVQRHLSGQLEQLSNTTAEQMRDLRRQQSELQALRCQPLRTAETRLRHVLQHAARELGCEVELVLNNRDVEIERMLLDRLLGPLEHVLRNAVVHGIEPVPQRQSIGKPVTGRVTISAAVTGNELQLVVQDDGRGLNLQRIRQRAIDAGLLREGDDPDQGTLSALIFAPGLSTASNLTALSGRGIGMDAVRAEVTALGGQISVESEAGRGCRFTLRLPMGMASVMVVLARAGQWRVGLPASLVKQVLQVNASTMRCDTYPQIEWQGVSLPLLPLGQMLGDTSATAGSGAIGQALLPVIIASEGDQTMALQLDAMEGQRELIVKHPGPQLSRVPGLAGASVLADGKVVLIIHPFRLPQTRPPVASASPQQQPATVLVVDDSLTVRRASQRLLERHGYAVALARDGVEALAFLQTASAALVLLDIEMPRMDGFELLGILRDDARWRSLPVVMITSRMADRHRERALQLGATAYMGKPYSEQALLTLMTEIMTEPISSATPDNQDFFTTA